jgi:hypothetical protein
VIGSKSLVFFDLMIEFAADGGSVVLVVVALLLLLLPFAFPSFPFFLSSSPSSSSPKSSSSSPLFTVSALALANPLDVVRIVLFFVLAEEGKVLRFSTNLVDNGLTPETTF